MHRIISLFIITLSLCVVSCSSQHARPADNSGELTLTLFPTTEAAMKMYKTGIDDIMETVPGVEKNNPDNASPLSLVKDLVYLKIAWGYIAPNGKIIALTDGNTQGFWVLFIKNDHPILNTRGNTLTSGVYDSLVGVAIRPDRISRRWAGIFLVHEMSHALERMYKTNILPDESEFFAYDLEKRAYNHITNGKLDRALEKEISQREVRSHSQLLGILRSNEAVRYETLHNIDRYLNEEHPLGLAEGEMRLGFYLMALSIRIGEIHNYTRAQQVENLNAVLKEFQMFPVQGT